MLRTATRSPIALAGLRYSSQSILKIGTTVKRSNDDTEFITHPLFPHPKFGHAQCEEIHVEHREPVTRGDRIALRGIGLVRGAFDLVTGYKKAKTQEELDSGFVGTRYEMTPAKWMTRCIFLELIAGVPGMVAAFIRHLHSLRLLRRDKAWIETLLDEAYNERLHLLTFIKMAQPLWFTRLIIYVGQGVFCNIFFLAYLVNPRYCHRFVGYLEEEAVSTYTHLIHEIDAGRLSELEKVGVPMVAQQYWLGLNEKSTVRDLILYIRADEAKHREVNHTLANLDQRADRNPFALKVDSETPQPDNYLDNHKGTGWERKDIVM